MTLELLAGKVPRIASLNPTRHQMTKIKLIFALLTCSLTINCYAQNEDPRTKLPDFFYNSSIGVNVGYSKFAFDQSNLAPGFTASDVINTRAGIRATIDHYFYPYLAMQISLMRPFLWVHYLNVNGDNDHNSVWTSLFGLALKPTWPITPQFKLFGEGGLGYISRHGFNVNGNYAIDNGEVVTPMVGGGLEYYFTPSWSADVSLLYAFANHSKNQPYTFYSGLGVRYHLLPPTDVKEVAVSPYIFPENMVQIGFMNEDFFSVDFSKYLTPPYLPIFWDSNLHAKNGYMFNYERNFFHTQKWFSLDWGVSGGYWTYKDTDQTFYTVSIFPEFKIWLLRCPSFDGYFTYEVAGPTYISRTKLGETNIGEHFTFQDFVGLGVLAGEQRNLNIEVRLVHFSNGNLFANNPGFNVPLMLHIGYAF